VPGVAASLHLRTLSSTDWVVVVVASFRRNFLVGNQKNTPKRYVTFKPKQRYNMPSRASWGSADKIL